MLTSARNCRHSVLSAPPGRSKRGDNVTTGLVTICANGDFCDAISKSCLIMTFPSDEKRQNYLIWETFYIAQGLPGEQYPLKSRTCGLA